MLRSLIKNATACAVSWTGLAAAVRATLHRDRPLVVCYHRVVERLNATDGFALPAMEISVATLERHLDWLGRHFEIVAPDDLDRAERGSRPLAVVTFDDGYSDVYEHAFPLLRRKGVPAGLFVITDLVGTTEPPLHERLHVLLSGQSRHWASMEDGLSRLLQRANVNLSVRERALRVATDSFSATRFLLRHLPQTEVQRVIDCLEIASDIGEEWKRPLQPLSWDMLAEMRDGGMTIGSHGKTHAFLTNESEDRVREETASSRRELERRLGIEVRTFAYPDGGFNQDVVHSVAASGYRYAFTTCSHRDVQHPLLTIPRIGLWEQSCLDPAGRFSPAIMSCQAASAFEWMSRCTQVHQETQVA